MRAPVVIASLICCSVLASVAAAQPTTPQHEVSPVTIYPAGGHPKVVATFPAAGQALPGGVLILTITFDQEISPGVDLAASAGSEPLECLKTPRLLDDGKTFAWLCTTGFGKSYSLTLNGGATGGFANVADQRAETTTLAFSTTTSTEGPRSVGEAVKQAKLKAFEIPIQETPGLAAKP